MLKGYLYACTYAATTSSKFRNDLLRIFPLNVSATMSILELGTHSGSTTAFFADTFAHVIAVDRDVGHLQRARQTIGERRNVAFFSLDLYQETWSQLLSNIIDVVFIDAAHDYVSVMSDTMNALQLQPSWIVFHDYGEFNTEPSKIGGRQVQTAVQMYVDASLLHCVADLGLQQGNGSEGKACQVGPASFSWSNRSHTNLFFARSPDTGLSREYEYSVHELPSGLGGQQSQDTSIYSKMDLIDWMKLDVTPSFQCSLTYPMARCSRSRKTGTVGFSDQDGGFVVARAIIAPSHANGSFLQQVWHFEGAILEMSFLPDFTSFFGTLRVKGVFTVDVVGIARRGTFATAVGRVLDASYLSSRFKPCCNLPPSITKCHAEDNLDVDDIFGNFDAFGRMVARYSQSIVYDFFPLCEDMYALPCSLLDGENGAAFKIHFRAGEWLDTVQANSLSEHVNGANGAAARMRELLRVQIAAALGEEEHLGSLEIHYAIRYSCPPSTRTRIAAVAAVALMNVLTVTTGRSLEPKFWEHAFYSLFTDFYPGGAIDFLNRSESILEEGRTNPRILVNSMFLRIIRF